ncbi:hypothetical protein [Dysgonomonas sp.]
MNRKFTLLLSILIIGSFCGVVAQVTIGSGIQPNRGVLLDLKEFNADASNTTSTKGFQLPRVALEAPDILTLIENPTITEKESLTGTLVYNTVKNDTGLLKDVYMWNGQQWEKFVGFDELKYTEQLIISGYIDSTGTDMVSFVHELSNNETYYGTGSYIDLPQGKWKVDVYLVLRHRGDAVGSDNYLWIRGGFSDTNNPSGNQLTTDVLTINGKTLAIKVGGFFPGPCQQDSNKTLSIFGSVFIENKSNITKRYYYVAGSQSIPIDVAGAYLKSLGGYFSENYIMASRIVL